MRRASHTNCSSRWKSLNINIGFTLQLGLIMTFRKTKTDQSYFYKAIRVSPLDNSYLLNNGHLRCTRKPKERLKMIHVYSERYVKINSMFLPNSNVDYYIILAEHQPLRCETPIPQQFALRFPACVSVCVCMWNILPTSS